MKGRSQSISCMPSKVKKMIKKCTSLSWEKRSSLTPLIDIDTFSIVQSESTVTSTEQEKAMERFILDMHQKAPRTNRRQSIAADEYQKDHRATHGSVLSWLRYTVRARADGPNVKTNVKTLPSLPFSRVVGWIIDEMASPGPIDSKTKRSTEQLIFDLHLNSPSKPRRQLEAVQTWKKERMRRISHPSSSEITMEQVMFDIYLNSPTKPRRQLEARKAWEKEREIMDTDSAVSCFPRCPAMYPKEDFLDLEMDESSRRLSM